MDETVAVSAQDIPAPRASEPGAPVSVPFALAFSPLGQGAPASGHQRVTSKFVRQHEELSVVAKELIRNLDSIKIAADPSVVRRMLASFSGKLRVHAAMEQEALYPRLLASHDTSVRDKAQELLDEVGDLYELFFQHLAKWSDGPAIKSDAESFCRETMQLLYRLKVRMKRENEELYPMVDGPTST